LDYNGKKNFYTILGVSGTKNEVCQHHFLAELLALDDTGDTKEAYYFIPSVAPHQPMPKTKSQPDYLSASVFFMSIKILMRK
jgi:hypothetical protein